MEGIKLCVYRDCHDDYEICMDGLKICEKLDFGEDIMPYSSLSKLTIYPIMTKLSLSQSL
ncbi:MAG: hypothetical protein K2I10_04450 [Lachnospiraceae bacterium]|nr:hypothetical protein [Lachnospiraceae bacterium]